MRVANQKDFAAGLLYLGLGVAVAVGSTQYRMGTAGSMGPGYFPFWLGVLLAVVGGVIAVKSLGVPSEDDDTRLEAWDLRSLAIITFSIVLFGVVLTTLGVVAAVIVLIVTSSLASHEFGWVTTVVNTAILLLITFLVFIYGLNLQFQIWPSFLSN